MLKEKEYNMLGKIKNFFKAIHRANKAEIEEIKNLQLSAEDREQGTKAAALAVAALAACGVPCGAAATPILQVVFAYVIRDIKDGVETPEKLLALRIGEELGKLDNMSID